MPYVRENFGSYNGWFDSVVDAAKSVIPSHTIVGKVIGGDVKGAATDAVALVRSTTTKAPTAQPIQGQTGPFYAGGFFERNQTAILIGAGALALFLVLRRR